MLVSLCNAAKRGVDVRIVTPGIPDKKMIFLLTQSHYEPLLKCGVKIYQYTPGFIHAKSFLCDDKIGPEGERSYQPCVRGNGLAFEKPGEISGENFKYFSRDDGKCRKK